ncbi:hypothetical protein, partial [Yersinia pekkanenii]
MPYKVWFSAIQNAGKKAAPATTSPKLSQENNMIKPHTIKENCRSRRDAQRKAKQQAYAIANPMSVGRKYQVDAYSTSPVRRAGYSPA